MNIWRLTGSIFVLITVCHAVDKTVSVGDRHVKATDVGGVVKLFKGTDENSGVTVKIHAVKEIDTGGMAIGTVGTTTRSFTDFTKTTFAISAESTVLYPGSLINVKKFSLSADLGIDKINSVQARLTAELFVFQAEEVVSIDGTYVKVRSGDVSFGVNIENWPFCGANNVVCDNGQANLIGTYLDVALNVNGQSAATLMTGTTMTYKLGDRPYIRVSNKVTADSSSTGYNMSANYPLLVTSPIQLFTSRLSPFTTSAKYNSLLSLGRDGVSFNHIDLDIKSRSGKMTYCDTRNEIKCITIEFIKLRETTAGGVSLDYGHVFDTFASQDFFITNMGQVTVQDTAAKHTRFNTTLTNGAILSVDTYLFTGDGWLRTGNETITIKAGHMKFSFDIIDWPFCGDPGVATCKQKAVGEFLYSDIEIITALNKFERDESTAPNKSIIYDLGIGKMILAKVYKKDDTDVVMEDPFPVTLNLPIKQIVRLEFPKFANMIHYDYIFELYDEKDFRNASSIIASYATLLAVLIIVSLAF